MSDARPAGGRRTFLLLAASAVMLAILLSLGTWQVQRLHWKEGLLARIEERIHREPVAAADLRQRLSAGEDVEYVPVSVRGTFLNDREMYLLATYEGQSGWNVYTPLELEESGVSAGTVIVNRGFVPYDRRDPATRPGSQPEGPVSVNGLAREALGEKPGFIVPDNAPEENTYYWKDWSAMVAQAGLEPSGTLPYFIDAGEGEPGVLPIGGVTLIALPNNHLQYAVTWYGLAVALVGVLAFWFMRGRSRPSDP